MSKRDFLAFMKKHGFSKKDVSEKIDGMIEKKHCWDDMHNLLYRFIITISGKKRKRFSVCIIPA